VYICIFFYQFVDVLDAAAKPDATFQHLLEVSTNNEGTEMESRLRFSMKMKICFAISMYV